MTRIVLPNYVLKDKIDLFENYLQSPKIDRIPSCLKTVSKFLHYYSREKADGRNTYKNFQDIKKRFRLLKCIFEMLNIFKSYTFHVTKEH